MERKGMDWGVGRGNNKISIKKKEEVKEYRGITLTSMLYKIYTIGKIREGNGRRKDDR